MLYGNMTLSRKPDEDELRSNVICSSCLKECEETGINESFDDAFGQVSDWGIGSDCCAAECFEGVIFLDKCRNHTSRKDHLNSDGSIKIAKGQSGTGLPSRKGYTSKTESIRVFAITASAS